MPKPTLTATTPTRPAPRRLALGTLAALCALAMVVGEGGALDALQKMAGGSGSSTQFGQIRGYLDRLRDSLIPLAIPLGAIGLTGGGVAYMVGNAMAQRILGGVVIGLALVLLSPSIVA